MFLGDRDGHILGLHIYWIKLFNQFLWKTASQGFLIFGWEHWIIKIIASRKFASQWSFRKTNRKCLNLSANLAIAMVCYSIFKKEIPEEFDPRTSFATLFLAFQRRSTAPTLPRGTALTSVPFPALSSRKMTSSKGQPTAPNTF